jgi:hypothetical protein
MKKWLCVLMLAACSKASRPDAGGSEPVRPPKPSYDAGSVLVHRATDLRTAMMEAYPEFRGARIVEGSATLFRRLDRNHPLDEVIPIIEKNGFTVTREEDRLTAYRAPYTLEVLGPNVSVSLPLVDGDAAKLLGAPSSMSTEQLSLWFPKVAGSAIDSESFQVRLKYEGNATRAGYIAWQLVSLSTAGSWKVEKYPEGYELARRPDGGGGGTPDEYSLTMVDSNTKAKLDVRRKGAQVDVRYTLKTYEWE